MNYYFEFWIFLIGEPDRKNVDTYPKCLKIALDVMDNVLESVYQGHVRLWHLKMVLNNKEKFLEMTKTHGKQMSDEETGVTVEAVLSQREAEFQALKHMDEAVRNFFQLTSMLTFRK